MQRNMWPGAKVLWKQSELGPQTGHQDQRHPKPKTSLNLSPLQPIHCSYDLCAGLHAPFVGLHVPFVGLVTLILALRSTHWP